LAAKRKGRVWGEGKGRKEEEMIDSFLPCGVQGLINISQTLPLVLNCFQTKKV
jgi:hypothetical protein